MKINNDKLTLFENIAKSVLKENAISVPFVSGVKESMRKAVLSKIIQEHPELDPTGFYYTSSGDLKHNGKKTKKSTKKIVKKPEGMSDVEFLKTIVPQYNKRYAKGLEKLVGDDIEKLEWKPLNIGELRDFKTSEEFSQRYWISNLGAVTTEYPDDASKCRLSIPYFDNSTKKFQINLRIYDELGKEKMHLCPSVVNLVKNAFGEESANKLIEIEKTQIMKSSALTNSDETEF